MKLHRQDGRDRVNLMAEGLSFTLNDGYTAMVGPEEGRVYDRIINSNVGVIAETGLKGEY